MKTAVKSRTSCPAMAMNLNIFERSIDMECAVDEIKQKGFTQKLADLTNKNVRLNKHEELQLAIIMVKSGMKCSTKTRPLTAFMFDAVMSFGHIVRAFKDEPELTEQNFMMRCANDYAVKKNLINQEYNFDRQMKNTNEEQKCNDFETKTVQMMMMYLPAEPKCIRQQAEKNFEMALRTVLLTQVELTTEQRKIEMNRFHDSMMIVLDDDATCELEVEDATYQLENTNRRENNNVGDRSSSSEEWN